MKILDEIMALDRAGTPVKYRDLLPVAEAVRELERAVRADSAKSLRLDHLTQAFEKWETACRAGETMSVEEAAQMTVQEAAARNAEHFLKLLAEVQL